MKNEKTEAVKQVARYQGIWLCSYLYDWLIGKIGDKLLSLIEKLAH
jgi:hypothetical protein